MQNKTQITGIKFMETMRNIKMKFYKAMAVRFIKFMFIFYTVNINNLYLRVTDLSVS